MNASGCLFIASRYIFQASGCFFQHPDTLCYTNLCFAFFSKFLSFFPIDSLYSFIKPCLVLLGLISKHYLKIKVVCFEFFYYCLSLLSTFQLQLSGYSLPVSGCLFSHSDTTVLAYPNVFPCHLDTLFTIWIPSLGIRIPSASAA